MCASPSCNVLTQTTPLTYSEGVVSVGKFKAVLSQIGTVPCFHTHTHYKPT